MTPEEEIKALKKIILDLGDATADVLDQMLLGNWVDDNGHDVVNNTAMIKLGEALTAATDHAMAQKVETEGGYYATS